MKKLLENVVDKYMGEHSVQALANIAWEIAANVHSSTQERTEDVGRGLGLASFIPGGDHR